MNSTVIRVGVLFECSHDGSLQLHYARANDISKSEAEIGCQLVFLLQDMLRFNASYRHYSVLGSVHKTIPGSLMEDLRTGSLDLCAGPLRISRTMLDSAAPLIQTHTQRLGFSLISTDVETLRSFYSEPFRRPVWLSVIAVILLATLLLHMLHLAEKSIVKAHERRRHRCSLVYELFAALAASCQISVPICARLCSRRLAYMTFLLFTLLVNNFYTSKIVSILLNTTKSSLSLRILADSDIPCVVLKKDADVFDGQLDAETEYIRVRKLKKPILVDLATGVDLMQNGTHALFSDYVSTYTTMTASFQPWQLCATTEVDVFPKAFKYFWSVKASPHIEQFKIALLMMLERGELSRLRARALPARAECSSGGHAHVRFTHVQAALLVLGALYALSVLVLLVEIYVARHSVIRPYCA